MKIQIKYNHAFTDDEFTREEQNEHLRNLGEHRSKKNTSDVDFKPDAKRKRKSESLRSIIKSVRKHSKL